MKNNLGLQGEDVVCAHLQKLGFKILDRNFRCRVGEVDIIAQKGELVAFVEVKSRRAEYFPISQVVTRSKQKKVVAAAKRFIIEKELGDKVFRFDVATVLFRDQGDRIELIENAFYGE